jgi:biopolymer transport protein ExbB/TolQ
MSTAIRTTTARPAAAGSGAASHRVGPLAYPATWLLWAVAMGFPFALMVFDRELMFERGWEQYAGTGIYLWALGTLAVELVRLGRNERALAGAPAMLDAPKTIADSDRRLLPVRLRTLATHAAERVPAVQLMELNREGSALDQEHAHGRFTLNRYILYLLPVIGFIGTVEGISKALMNISKVLPMVKDLDGFLSNLTGVTSALQIAFDSTLLALFLSAALMLIQTLVIRRSDDLLARVDGWVVEHVLPRLGTMGAAADPAETLARPLEELRAAIEDQTRRSAEALRALAERIDAGLASNVDRFAGSVDRLTPALADLDRGAASIAGLAPALADLAASGKSARRSAELLEQIGSSLARAEGRHEPALEAIRRGVERASTGVESLSDQWTAAFEKSSRTTQEQLARTLGSLKDALELLHVSMEQGNTLYRSIVKRLVGYPHGPSDDAQAA